MGTTELGIEETNHGASKVQKQRRTIHSQFTFSFLCSPEPELREWCYSLLIVLLHFKDPRHIKVSRIHIYGF